MTRFRPGIEMGAAKMMLQENANPPIELAFSVRVRDGFTIAALIGDLDVASAPVLREQLLGVLRAHASQIVVDLSKVSYCDASGLAVLVGTARRAGLLGGVLRLVAPAPAVAAAMHLTGLDRQLDIFPTVAAAITNSQAGRRVAGLSMGIPAPSHEMTARLARPTVLAPEMGTPDTDDLREAVTALLAHGDAWRDADPNRRLTPTLRTLARAKDDADHAALTEASRSLLAALIRHPLTHSPAVATTARDLRRVMDS
jgi:anti-sigma B factor antagonist